MSSSLYLNPGPPRYEAWVLTTRLIRSVSEEKVIYTTFQELTLLSSSRDYLLVNWQFLLALLWKLVTVVRMEPRPIWILILYANHYVNLLQSREGRRNCLYNESQGGRTVNSRNVVYMNYTSDTGHYKCDLISITCIDMIICFLDKLYESSHKIEALTHVRNRSSYSENYRNNFNCN
jgi:hypothetical protein